ncbi:MAG: phosphotransferase [Micrococcales bacterium]|nr:phosphotransferase [Micrococcales bacterium]
MTERQPLRGGLQTPGIARVGDTVRRPRRPGDARVIAVLRHLQQVGFDGSPRVVAEDDGGELVLTFLPGETVLLSPFRVSDARVASAGRLIRRFHDATAGSAVAAGGEAVLHGDLGPHNTVFRAEEAVGLIDWDADLRSGRRADDLAHAAWCFADLVDPLVPLAEQARKLRILLRAYGGIPAETVLDELAERFRRAQNPHGAAGRAETIGIFREMAEQLAASRPQLLAAAR